ncbi:hypothetical protein DRQ36_07055 [bacterium]|nr:MAG: hypothetical protein DRQ36_07055 [bacterium]
MKIFLAIVISLVVGFLVGFIPPTVAKAELKGELMTCGDNLKNVYERLEIAEAYQRSLLEFIGAYKATASKNYGIAQERAISGFDMSKPLVKADISEFVELAPRRDEIVSVLAKGGEDAEPTMRELLFGLYRGE